MVAVVRGGGWMIPVLGLGVVGLGLWLGPGPFDRPTAAAPGPSATAASSVTPAVQGLRAELLTDEKPAGDGRFEWWTTWRLCWDPVVGASEYVITTVSFEGAGAPRAVTAMCHDVGVASGTTTDSGTYPGLSEQLAHLEISMSVSVAARLPDGTLGPASADIPVGTAYP